MAAVHRLLQINDTHRLEGRYHWQHSHNANRSIMLPVVVSSIELCQVIQFLLNLLMHLKKYTAGLSQKQEAPSGAWRGAKWQHQKPSLELERWPSGQQCILLLRRTWVRFLASTPGGSQSLFMGYNWFLCPLWKTTFMWTHAHCHLHTIIIKNKFLRRRNIHSSTGQVARSVVLSY